MTESRRRKAPLRPSRRSIAERNALVEANQGLIGLTLTKPLGRLLRKLRLLGNYQDTFQALQFCLMRAAELWDEKKLFAAPGGEMRPIRFSTYASMALKNRVIYFLEEKRVKCSSLNSESRPGTTRFIANKMLCERSPIDRDHDLDMRQVWIVRLQKWLGVLRPRDRQVLMMSFFQGMTFVEISLELKVSRERIRQIYERGLRHLKQVAQEQEERKCGTG